MIIPRRAIRELRIIFRPTSRARAGGSIPLSGGLDASPFRANPPPILLGRRPPSAERLRRLLDPQDAFGVAFDQIVSMRETKGHILGAGADVQTQEHRLGH